MPVRHVVEHLPVADTAAAIAGNTGTAAATSPTLELRQATITAVDLASATCSIAIGGDPTSVPHVHYLSNFKPSVGDCCFVLVNGPDLVALDRDGRFGSSAFAGYRAAEVSVGESRVSRTWGDLPTHGPELTITVPSSGTILLGISCFMQKLNPNADVAAMAWQASGANTIPVGRPPTCQLGDGSHGGPACELAAVNLVTDLTPGDTTITAKYCTQTGGEAAWHSRTLWAIPI